MDYNFDNKENNQETISLLNNMIEDAKNSTTNNKLDNELISNEDLLNDLQKSNEDFYSLNVINTSKNDNDSKNDISYLTYLDKYGRVRVANLNNNINDYLKSSINAEDLFNHYKDSLIKFYNEDYYLEFLRNENDKAIINDISVNNAEMQKIREFCNAHGLVMFDIEMGIDKYGERLYRVGGTLIKFKNHLNDRQLEVLESSNLSLQIPNDVDVKTNEIDFNSIEYFNNLVYKSFQKGEILSEEENNRLENYVDYLLQHMEDKIKNNEDLNDEFIDALNGYMELLGESHVDNMTGKENKNITNRELVQLSMYNELVPKIKITKKKIKKLENNKKDEKEAGLINTIIIVELCTLASIVISFIAHI